MKRFHKVVLALAVVAVVGVLTVGPGTGPRDGQRSILNLLGMERTGDASIIKYLMVTRTCAEANVIEVNAGEVPGFPQGGPTWLAADACAPNNEFSKCILCEPMQVGAKDEEGGGSGAEEIRATDTKTTRSCGDMFKGTCRIIDGMMRCVKDTGDSTGDCKEVSTFNRQPIIPDSPVGSL